MVTDGRQSKLVNLHLPCPLCDSSDAFAEYDDGHGYCFSCQGYVASKSTLEVQQPPGYTYEYVPWRNISANSFRTYSALTKVDDSGKPISISFRYPNGDCQIRLIDKKEFYWIKSGSTEHHGLFGRDKFAAGSHRDVVITEGALDAQSLYQVLRVPCVSVVSSSSALSDCTVDRSYLNSFERIYLAFDSDAPGREATARVAKLFDYNKVWQLKFSNRKDANEYLLVGEEGELLNIFRNSRRYLPESILSSSAEFDAILEGEPRMGVAYPFGGLTEKTKGIRLGESVLITAQEGIGKTELMHAIEYKLLEETDANVGSLFLEELPRRHLQALAGIRLGSAVHLPESGYSTSQVRQALRDTIKTDDRLFVYTNFGSDDPDVLLDTIRFLVAGRDCKYILLDHISMVVSGLSTEDERRKLDYISTKLEMMVKELGYALIVVSHVNDLGQTRGSRYIGKIADIRIDAQRDLEAGSDIERRTIHLKVSKNRPAWETGRAGSYLFDPLTNSYKEMLDVPSNDNYPPIAERKAS
jgi:twinkle protein